MIIFPRLVALMIVAFLFSCNAKDNSNPRPSGTTQLAKDTSHPITAESKNAFAAVDVSPMDMSYFPIDYPKIKMDSENMTPPVMRVIYSRPQLNGRKLFNGFLKYGEPWRLGANEATEIEFYRNVNIQDKKIKKGRYVLYCIPEPDQWTIILNSKIESWGLKQDPSKDVARFVIPVTHHNPMLEYFTIVFEPIPNGANLIMAWEEDVAKLPINF